VTFKSQRTVARFSLALFVLFAMVVAVAPGISLGGMLPAALQTTSSPSESGSSTASPSDSASPSATASPSPTGPAIQFLNPSGHSTIVSTKSDGTNTTYHLVAAARSLPANPLVEFKYQEGTSNEVSIGIASRVGTTDTFHLQWAAGSLADGTYMLKAVLFSGSIELARDEEEITVNNEDTTIPVPDPQAETVEITAPANGTDAGFFQSAGAATARTLVAVTSSEALDPPSLSTGTASVVVYYTKSAPGTEPEWIECGDEAPAEGGNKIACTLAEGEEGAPSDVPSQVTGLAAVANSDASDLVDGSGDAHRVLPYVQIPTSFTLSPATQTAKPAGTCADPITATALDQDGRPIAGMNVDVHSKGPSDGLRFDGVGNSASQAPDEAHTEPEEAWGCEAGESGGEQGDHELSPGNPDIKHIESVDGTSNDGTFVFQLYSPDQGTTDFAIFADVDDDDLWCADEESFQSSLTWSPSASPSPTPTASESGSPSASPTGTATASPEPTTLGPDVATCPTPTASPTPGEANRTISLAASKRKVVWGRGVTLAGQITSDDTTCVNNEVVEIRRRFHGSQQFNAFRTTATDEAGDYDVDIVVRRNADYQAVTPESAECDEATSSATTVLAKVKIFIRTNDRTPERGTIVRINGRVAPKKNGDKVVLQYKKGKRWVRLDTDNLNRKSRYAFRTRADWKARVFRVRWAAQDNRHASATSSKVRVRSHR
jgi:hypothetical protein